MSQFIETNIEQISTMMKHSSYVVSSGMILSSVFDFMNNNIGVIGFGGLIATWLLTKHLGDKKMMLEENARNKDREMESKWREAEYNLKAEDMKRRKDDE